MADKNGKLRRPRRVSAGNYFSTSTLGYRWFGRTIKTSVHDQPDAQSQQCRNPSEPLTFIGLDT